MDGAVVFNTRHQFFLLGQALHQHTGAAVDKTLSQALMQGIRQLVLYLSRVGLPIERCFQPIGTVSDEGPGADVADAVRQGIKVAMGVLAELQLAHKPVLVDDTLAGLQEVVDLGNDGGMLGIRDVAVVGDLADFPQALDIFSGCGKIAGLGLAAQGLKCQKIGIGLGARQARRAWKRVQR